MTMVLSEHTSKREQVALDQVVRRLHERFPGVSEQQIDLTVQEEYHRFDGSPIRDFVPIFVERNARVDLTSLSE